MIGRFIWRGAPSGFLFFFKKKKEISGLRLSKMAAIIEIEGADSVIPIKISSAGH